MNIQDRYFIILKVICDYYGLSDIDVIQICKDKDIRYLLLLFFKKYNCLNSEELKDILNVKTNRSVYNNIKRAEEHLLINRDFRNIYFEIEDGLLKNN